MGRTYSEHSYKLIQKWLKNEYAVNPDFRQKQIDKASMYQYKTRYRKLIDITILENYARSYLLQFPSRI